MALFFRLCASASLREIQARPFSASLWEAEARDDAIKPIALQLGILSARL
jgi:hypothetical protein